MIRWNRKNLWIYDYVHIHRYNMQLIHTKDLDRKVLNEQESESVRAAAGVVARDRLTEYSSDGESEDFIPPLPPHSPPAEFRPPLPTGSPPPSTESSDGEEEEEESPPPSPTLSDIRAWQEEDEVQKEILSNKDEEETTSTSFASDNDEVRIR
jgi:hypothetical protein